MHRQQWKWQAMDSKHSAAPLGGQKTGKNPTDRGKLGAKINLLLVDGRGAPISVVLTGANRHNKVSAMDLIISVVLKRPAHKEQHLCAENAYDSDDLREFVDSLRATSSTSRSMAGEKAPSVHRVRNPQRGFTRRGDG
jgi:putative transposase